MDAASISVERDGAVGIARPTWPDKGNESHAFRSPVESAAGDFRQSDNMNALDLARPGRRLD
jgi:hypothetical protein